MALVQDIRKFSDGHPMYCICILGKVHVQMHDENSNAIRTCTKFREVLLEVSYMYFHTFLNLV